MDPAVLVLDEPTTGQDGPGIARVGAIVDALARRRPDGRRHHPRHGVRGPPLRADRRACGAGSSSPTGRRREVLAAANAPLLASTGLEPPPLAVLAGWSGSAGCRSDRGRCWLAG